MTGDFTRDSFEPTKNFTRVLMQQGRPQLDADLNEQIAIFWRYWRTLVSDLVGPFAGPYDNCGFGVITPGVIGDDLSAKQQEHLRGMLKEPGEFLISPGHYYVNGILCENSEYIAYSAHIDPWETMLVPKKNAPYLIYLDVWERPVTYLEDGQLYEPALNGIDTSIRTKVMWRVRIWELPDKNAYGGGDCSKVRENWTTVIQGWQAEHRGRLRAQTSETADGTGHEHEHAMGRGYRGVQNQLYRVEIHHEGVVGSGAHGPTFKVSRENGSVLFRIVSIDNKVLTLDQMGRDARFGLKTGDWVEICEGHIGGGVAGPLLQVQIADSDRRTVTLSAAPAHRAHRHYFLRRWDHKAGDPKKGGLELRDGAAILKEGEGNNAWLSLEHGVRIQFHKSSPANRYRTGDYWLIPARVATGDVLWPHEHGKPKTVAPHGVQHHYAPLAIVSFDANGILETQGDCRPKFKLPVAFGF